MPTRLLCLALLLLLAGCGGKQHTVTRGFYYWKTSLDISTYERNRLRDAGCGELYLRCFDVVKEADGEVRPAGIVRNLDDTLQGLRITPVVYITQDALNATRGPQIPELAANIGKLLASLRTGKPAPPEVQIDCDWTASTRDAYFALLRALRAQPFFARIPLSCTIRLHQIKYRSRSGLPPVDRGLLMCYNMGSMSKAGPHNSILNPALAEDYLQQLGDYPLPLDIALPLFEWSLLFRDGIFKGILRDVSPDRVAGSSLFRASGTNLFSCLADSSFGGYELRAGDQIRTERSAPDVVLRMARFASRQLPEGRLRVLLFHCDSLTLVKHPHDELEAVYGAFE